MYAVLLLEDDDDLRQEMCESLSTDGFAARGAGTVKAFWEAYRSAVPDAVVLDMTLPDGAGLAVAKDLRTTSDLGIVFLSGRRDETDRIVALEVGADDFIVKPCSPRELSARLNAVLRRCRPPVEAAVPSAGQAVSFCGFRLDLGAMALIDPDGQPRDLTTAEFDLLKALAMNPKRVMSRAQLTDSIRGQDWDGYDRTIDGLISRLRKKLKHDDVETQILRTVHGAGYIFTPDVR